MKHLAAYLLAMLGGQKNPTADTVKKILNSVGAQADDAKIKQLVSELNGKDIEEVIAAGQKKMAAAAFTVAAAPAAPAAAPAAAGKGAAPAGKAAPPPKEEEEEEELGLGLFD